jgi:hypothetical protein
MAKGEEIKFAFRFLIWAKTLKSVSFKDFYLWVLHPVAHLSNWFFMMPSIAAKFQYVNSLLFSFSLTTCFGPYGPSSGEIYN